MINIRRVGLLISLFLVLLASVVYVVSNSLYGRIETYPSSEQITREDGRYYTGDIVKRSLYYWTNDPLVEVIDYYENQNCQFDESDQWVIAGFRVSGEFVEPTQESTVKTHSAFCPDVKDQECVTIAILDASVTARDSLIIMNPNTAGFSLSDSAFSDIPSQGTVIIFTYWHNYWFS